MEQEYAPCGGCGATHPKQRCLGCMHQFEAARPKAELININNMSSLETQYNQYLESVKPLGFEEWKQHAFKNINLSKNSNSSKAELTGQQESPVANWMKQTKPLEPELQEILNKTYQRCLSKEPTNLYEEGEGEKKEEENELASKWANSTFQHCSYHYDEDTRLTDFDARKESFLAGYNAAVEQLTKESEEEKEQWISVKDRLPDKGGRYLGFVEEVNDLGISHYVWNCYYNDSNKDWSDNLTSMIVTHWMPLPHPPTK